MTTKVLGIGNALVDVLLRREDGFLAQHGLPKGSMTLVDHDKVRAVLLGATDFATAAGGCAANTINGLAQLGVPSGFLGTTGDDEFGRAFAADLHANGVTPHILRRQTQTGRAVAVITPDSERTFATYLGAAIEMGPDDLSPEVFAGYGCVHIEGYLVQNHDLVRRAMTMARAAGCKVSLDLASYNVVEANLEFLTEMVGDYVDIVFANEEEAKAFTGREHQHALDALGSSCEVAVVKLGRQGSLARRGQERASAGVIPANAVDTTGAGDLYAAGFLYGLVNGHSLERCCRLGALTAGCVVEVMGAKMPPATWERIRSEASGIVSP